MPPIQTTMTGSWFRTEEVIRLLSKENSPSGEISTEYHDAIDVAERRAVRDQLHPANSPCGLDWVSNGEQRKSGYAVYLPSRFAGFSRTEKVTIPVLPSFIEEMQESNEASLAARRQRDNSFAVAKMESKLEYTGASQARNEARAASRIRTEEGAKRIFLPAPSPGAVTICFPRGTVYSTHDEYLFDIAKQMRKEYETILSVEGVDLQIDAPDLAMGKQRGIAELDFFEYLPKHVNAVNEAIKGLPRERIRVHYCYGNWVGSHKFDADYRRVLPELLRLKAGTIVGEMANPRHEGDALILEEYLKEHEWPKGTRFAMGAVDVKSTLVETRETVAVRLERVGRIAKIDPNYLLGGTDCGFETFAGFGNVSYPVALLKLRALVEGASLASKRLGLD
ncbi:MAG: uroporphyrinogen decarboxylase/cobalamine-independent methonine synthase family protein [Nitrososphaerales archaeon]